MSIQKLPLEGIRVVEVATAWAGPRVCRILCDMGAEVIKIEKPARPDGTRRDQPFAEGISGVNRSGSFHSLNVGKKSVTINLKQPEGKTTFKNLVKTSDIVVENFAPRVMESLGLGYEILKKIKPDIIMVSMSGFGATGPDSDRVAFGSILEAYSGLQMVMRRDNGLPNRCGTPIADHVSGVSAAFATLAALYHRKCCGEGQHLDISEVESLLASMPEAVLEYTMNGRLPAREGNRDEVMVPHNVYKCEGDDKWVAIAIDTDEEWQSFCRAIERPDLAANEKYADKFRRFQHEEELDTIISEWCSDKDHYDVMQLLQAAGIMAAPTYNQEELFNDPHIKKRGFLIVMDHPEVGKRELPGPFAKLSKTPGKVRSYAPLLGEHNDWVYNKLLRQEKHE